MGTKSDPGAYDCLARAEPDEPLFVLLARDPTAYHLVRIWAAVREGDRATAAVNFQHLMADWCAPDPSSRTHRRTVLGPDGAVVGERYGDKSMNAWDTAREMLRWRQERGERTRRESQAQEGTPCRT